MADIIEKIQVGANIHPIDRVYNAFTASSTTGSSTSGSVKSVRWYVSGIDGITTPYDGMKVAIKIPRAGIATGGVVFSINGNNEADYHPVAYNLNTVFTSHYAVGVVKIFIYDATAKMTCYISAGTAVEITGVWKGEGDYNSNSTSYLSYTATPVTSGTTVHYILSKRVASVNGTNYYNANVYYEGDGTLNAPEFSENGVSLASKYQAKLPTYTSSNENYVLSINSSGELTWRAPYNGAASGS